MSQVDQGQSDAVRTRRESHGPSDGQLDKQSTKMSISSTEGNESGKASLAAMMMMKRRVTNWTRSRQPGSRKTSSVDAPRIKSLMRKENTYQIDPKDRERFDVAAVKQEMNDSLKLFLSAMQTYETKKCSQIARYVAEDIKGRIKKLGCKRHKIVAHVVVGQPSDANTITVSSRCIWDDSRDNYAAVTFKSKAVYAVATVFGVYFD